MPEKDQSLWGVSWEYLRVRKRYWLAPILFFLLSISALTGVKDASRFVLKNARFVGALLRSGGIYRPTQLLRQLAPLIADPAANVLGLHVYTFNNVPATEAWRREAEAAAIG